MAIDPDHLLALDIPAVEQSYTERDTMLYALGIGYGHDPLDEKALRYCYEKDLRAAPTMPVAIAHPGFWMRDLDTGIDWKKIVHGEQELELHGEIPVAARVVSKARVTDVIDKGPGKGAVVIFERDLIDADSNRLIATMRQSNFCRGDGGFSKGAAPTAARPPAPSPQAGAPDMVVNLPTRPETALIGRLCADPNPLHVEVAAARAAGFDRPILHGLISYGIAAHAIVKAVCDFDASRLRRISCRFAGIIYPGKP